MMGFAEPVIGPATSGGTCWLYPSYALKQLVGLTDAASPLGYELWRSGLTNSRRRGAGTRFDDGDGIL